MEEEDHPWVFPLDTIKRIAVILDSLLHHLPLLISGIKYENATENSFS